MAVVIPDKKSSEHLLADELVAGKPSVREHVFPSNVDDTLVAAGGVEASEMFKRQWREDGLSTASLSKEHGARRSHANCTENVRESLPG
jgi:hypothetical protein